MKKYTVIVALLVASSVFLLMNEIAFGGQLGSELKLQPQTGPTLEETMNWIKDKLSGYSFQSKLDYIHADLHEYITKNTRYHNIDVKGCVLKYQETTSKTDYAIGIGGLANGERVNGDPKERTEDIEVDFSNIGNVSSMLLPDERGTWTPSIYLIKTPDAIFMIFMTDADLTERMVKALNHAAKLCGTGKSKQGNKEPF